MSGLDYRSGDKIAEAIDRRIVSVAKQVYEKSPNNKTKYGKVLSKKDGLFTVEIEKSTYTKVPALRNVGNINIGEIVVCMIPNNQFSNIMVLGVADGTLIPTNGSEGGGSPSIKVVDNLSSTSTTDALSANQGNILNEKINNINDTIKDIKVITKTSELENDGDGTSPFATEKFVEQNGGKIDSISINGTVQSIDENKNVNLSIPTKVGQLENDSNFISNTVDNLVNYYNKVQTDTLLDGKVDKLDGKGLSTEDFTTAEKNKLNDIEEGAQKNTVDSVNGKTGVVVLTSNDVGALPTTTNYGASLDLSIDSSTYIVTAQLKDQNGNNLGVAKTIDLPLESVVVNGSYDSITKEVVLTLDNGSEIKFSVADLVSGLQTEITTTNKLASDLVDDTNSVNKFVTQDEKDKLEGIEAGANKTVVDDALSVISTNPVQNKLVTEKLNERVNKTSNETIGGVKTFSKQPVIADDVTESWQARGIVSADAIRKYLRENYQEILIAGNNITFDGNTISANLEGSTPIMTLTSPVVIYDLPSGVYQLPTGCDLYINSSYVETDTKVNYDNTSVALMVVASITNPDSRVDKLFYLFAEVDGYTASDVGNTGSFIIGKAKQSSGHYHIAGTDIKYVELETDGYIGGNKSFLNPVKYYHQYESLATSLNDRTLVDAQWVNAVLADKGYLTSAPVSSVNGKTGTVNLTARDVGALSDYTLTINHGTAGNPRMVKFITVNYATSATCFKMGAMTCHDNGVSYQFLTDMLIAVTTAGEVTANIYKFAQSSVGNVDGVARYTGDVFYVNDTTNKIVDFYILCGQYSSSQFTPVTKVGSTTIAYVTQYTGNATYYSSGTKVWVNGCGSTYARTSDLDTRLALDGSNTMTGKLNLKSYGPNEGNIGSNGIAWDTTSLPEDTAPQFVCTIDGFANGGRQKWASIANLKAQLGIPSLLSAFPVGAIYMSIVNTSPASFLGGTWTAIPAGYALWTATSGAGGTISAGLPNITGDIQKVSGNHFLLNAVTSEATSSGAFYIASSMTTGYANSTGSKNMIRGLGFDASRSNSIYGASSTVQPPAYKVYAWRRTG